MGDRVHWIGAPAFFNLDQQCRVLVEAYGWNVYLVGSALERRDHRDVDIRVILENDVFDRMFPGAHPSPERNALWSVTCAAMSEWLGAHTHLPIDFQIQRQAQANAMFAGTRIALGVFLPQPEVPK